MSSASPLPFHSDPGGSAASRRLQTLAYELTVAEARERQRIAHVLHDEIGQLLAMAQMRLGELGHSLVAEPAQADVVNEIRSLLYQAAQATRATTFELHPAVLRQLGLAAAIESLVQRMQRISRMRVHLSCEPAPAPSTSALPQAVCSVLLRTVRELVLNAQKHAQAVNLWITMDQPAGELRISVVDDGVGFDVDAVTGRFSPEGGFGLVSIEAQMQSIGGTLSIESVTGHGTEAVLSLPLAEAPVPVYPRPRADVPTEPHA